jgi:hypothetical protein
MIAAFCRTGSIFLLLASAASGSDGVTVITTPGSGTLTMCRDWLVYDSCIEYHNVALPQRLAVGEAVPLSFGSDNKHYNFPVAKVIKNGIVCTVLSDADSDMKKINKIKVTSCMDVSNSH